MLGWNLLQNESCLTRDKESVESEEEYYFSFALLAGWGP